MSARNLEGMIHWSLARVLWTGDGFVVELRNTIGQEAAAWLNLNLDARLQQEFGSEVRATVSPAIPAVSDEHTRRSGYEEFGTLEIGPLAVPLPNPGALHRVISAALAEAYEQVDRAEAMGGEYLRQLRAFGQPSEADE